MTPQEKPDSSNFRDAISEAEKLPTLSSEIPVNIVLHPSSDQKPYGNIDAKATILKDQVTMLL